MRALLPLLLALGFSCPILAQSVLSTGEWHKVSIKKTGVYKIDRSFLSSELKIDLKNFDPTTFKVYGSTTNGVLPQANDVFRPNDPQEIAIYGSGTADGSMDEGDYFLFVGFSPDHFRKTDTLTYLKNYYTDDNHYLLTYGGNAGKRITQSTKALTPNPNTKKSFTQYIIHESDEINRFRTGRIWVGEKVSAQSGGQISFRYPISDALGKVGIQIGVTGECYAGCDYDISINDNVIGNLPVKSILRGIQNAYKDDAQYANGFFSASTLNGDDLRLKIAFNEGDEESHGYLDYYILSYERTLQFAEKQLLLHLGTSNATETYEINEAPADVKVWNVTNRSSIESLPITLEGGNAVFSIDIADENTLVTLTGSDFPKPVFKKKIDNQNIKSLTNADGIIVTHPRFLGPAMDLKNFHESFDGLTVGVVTTEQVYNEFSSGSQDISAIRDFFKYLYDQGGQLKYGLLFGDASYDYKDKVKNNTNFVPVYESRDSFHPILSHSSDDYFGFLEDHEGEWSEGVRLTNSSTYIVPYNDHTLEIGIGRITVTNLEDAQGVVDKIIRYKTSDKTYGKWRNDIAYFSDDGDGGTHMSQADELFKILDSGYSQYNAKKLYLDNFDQPDGTSPKATDAILNAFKEGVFIFNYMGHGNHEKLASENVFTSTVIQKLTNRQKMPLFVAATCDFGKYDDPVFESGCEKLLISPNGGAISLICTTRPVYAHTNLPVNKAFHNNVFQKINGEYPRLGDVIRLTKNNSLRGPVNRNFALLGDPMLRLNYPEYEIIFDQMTFTDDSLSIKRDTLSALENYTLSGRVQADGSIVNSFEGNGIITIWDVPQEKITKGIGNLPHEYKDQTNALYRGEVTVRDGTFSLDMVLPKNISYQFNEGKLTMYAWNADEPIDASGASKKFVLGGTAPNVGDDNIPPNGFIYLNDPSFTQGDKVGTSSLFIAQLSDESGINISNNGFNNSITLTLNDDEPIVLNDYYTASPDNYQKGAVMFPLQNLAPGHYSGELKFWDTHNNPASARVEFNVSDKPVLRLYNTNLYPNPVRRSEETTFVFEHDREGEELEIDISLYSMSGHLVHKHHYRIDNSPRLVDDISWRVDEFQGAEVQEGIYIYKLHVNSTLDGANNEIIKRLVIIN